MIIGFDAKRAFYNYRGIGSYSRSIIKGLCQHYGQNEYHCYSPKINAPLALDPEATAIAVHLEHHLINSLWRTFGVSNHIRKDHIDVFHGLSNELPYASSTKTKFVVTIHDLLFIKRKNDYPLLDRQIYKAKVAHALQKADVVVTVSNNTKVDLLESYSIEEDRIQIVAPICNDIFFQAHTKSEQERFRDEMGLPENFLLFVGALTENKNLFTLLRALQLVPDQTLVIVGAGPLRGQLNKFIENKNLVGRVFFVNDKNYINQYQLSILYQSARVTVIPSYYEGFGLPIIESLACKTPVICSGTSALPETCGPGGLVFNPEDPEELTGAIKKLFDDSQQHGQFVNAGYNHAIEFQSHIKCKELMAIYSELVN